MIRGSDATWLLKCPPKVERSVRLLMAQARTEDPLHVFNVTKIPCHGVHNVVLNWQAGLKKVRPSVISWNPRPS